MSWVGLKAEPTISDVVWPLGANGHFAYQDVRCIGTWVILTPLVSLPVPGYGSARSTGL